MTTLVQETRPRPSRLRRILSAVAWYLIPSLVAACALSYFAYALVERINPPVLAVQGTSMLPTLRTGDLVILRHANVKTLDRGDIIALKVPTIDQKTYGLPASVVHRIIQVQHTNFGVIYVTKGDHNAGPDLFHTQFNAVIGQLRGVVPGVGYPLLFVESRDGKIFLASLVIIALLYLLFGFIEDRRLALRSTELTVQTILNETQRIERLVTSAPLEPLPPTQVPRTDLASVDYATRTHSDLGTPPVPSAQTPTSDDVSVISSTAAPTPPPRGPRDDRVTLASVNVGPVPSVTPTGESPSGDALTTSGDRQPPLKPADGEGSKKDKKKSDQGSKKNKKKKKAKDGEGFTSSGDESVERSL
ncbi:MAG: signal peptidase I [Acidobacteriota bacterium]|nr:signal peptidase I [Acidobacteriota bacterium]